MELTVVRMFVLAGKDVRQERWTCSRFPPRGYRQPACRSYPGVPNSALRVDWSCRLFQLHRSLGYSTTENIQFVMLSLQQSKTKPKQGHALKPATKYSLRTGLHMSLPLIATASHHLLLPLTMNTTTFLATTLCLPHPKPKLPGQFDCNIAFAHQGEARESHLSSQQKRTSANASLVKRENNRADTRPQH